MIIIGIVYDVPKTGYDIKKEIEQGVGHFFTASYGSLYPALARMAGKGLLTMEEDPSSGRKKKFYQATKAAQDAFLAWMDEPFNPAAPDNVLLKIFFYGRLSPQSREKRLAELTSFHELMLHKLTELEKHLVSIYGEEELLNNDVEYFEVATLYYGIKNSYTTGRFLAHLAARRPHREFLEDKEQNNADNRKGSEFEKKLQIPRGFEGR